MSEGRYEEYKDSGIDWIGEMPSNWKLKKLKHILSERNMKNDPIKTNEILSLSAKQGVTPLSEKEYIGGNKPKDDLTQYKLAFPNDIVLNSMNIISGAVGLSKHFGCVSPVYYMFYSDDENVNIEYYTYLFQIRSFQRMLLKFGKGIMIKKSNSGKLNTIRTKVPIESFKNLELPYLDIKTQNDIVNYLNYHVPIIDKRIAKSEELIQLLSEKRISLINEVVTKGLNPNSPMKDSGIDWIGKIPEHWKLNRGKTILTLLKRPVKIEDEIITCFRDGEVTLRSKRRETGFTMSDKEIGYQGIEKDDLVVHGMDGFAGAIGISDSRGKGSPVLIVLDSIQNKKYLMYYLRNLAYNNIFLALSTGIRVRSCDLRWEKLANLPYLIPPLNEQNEISNYLDQEISRIYNFIKKIEKHNELLEEYKTSLIHQVVTGKIDVRE